jgi:hypothetical protein
MKTTRQEVEEAIKAYLKKNIKNYPKEVQQDLKVYQEKMM